MKYKTMRYPKKFGVIIIGGGHAGTEAALAAARLGVQTLLITHTSETLGQLSCNPSIGGIGKSHLVKEIDALGGAMGQAADIAGIHFRMLNSSKGHAVRATRVQVDRVQYKQAIRSRLEKQPNLSIFQDAVHNLCIRNGRVEGVITKADLRFDAEAVVLTAGTFLNGKIHIGLVNYSAGRAADPPSIHLANCLKDLSLKQGRLKTGTPPRIDGNTIDYTQLKKQSFEMPLPHFSCHAPPETRLPQVCCHIAYTNQTTHKIIQDNLDRSPLYRGDIKGIGPRYCPCIEDKIVRFADRTNHQIFIEPEGLHTSEIYPNGISTSLPFDVQYEMVRSMKGFEAAHITRPGYAIEYDFFDPRELQPSLETKKIKGLFFAGQVNGTTGYEEAAAQGLIAGLNAALQVKGCSSWTPRRNEAYMGVLIDDLITKGVDEPYRMFTSRAEYRLMLREDNADLRLTQKGHTLGLVNDEYLKAVTQKQESLAREQARLKSIWISPKTALAEKCALTLNIPISREQNLMDLLKRPELKYHQLMQIEELRGETIESSVSLQLEIQAKYAGYIERQQREIEKRNDYEDIRLPPNMAYTSMSGLSTELSQKLNQIKPKTVGMASRIPGMTPAAISILLIHLKKTQKPSS
jgi:tRNA uridine 5-carboxymethylaminomethyl modification enzyme